MFICCSDPHISEKKPVYRTDENWIDTCLDKFEQVCKKADEFKDCPVILAGDVLDRWSHSPELVNAVLKLLKKWSRLEFYIVPGNHDLKNHNMELLHKSQVMTLCFLDNVNMCYENMAPIYVSDPDNQYVEQDLRLDTFPFGSELKYRGGNIAVIHEFAYKEKPWNDAPSSGNYKSIIKKMSGYKIIIAGDNHEDFISEYKGCTFLNCGGMLRQKINEKDRIPKFYLVDDDLNIDSIPFRVKDDVFDFESAAFVKKKNKAIEQVAEQIANDISFDLDFKQNLENVLRSSEDVKDSVKQKIIEELENAQ